MNHLRRETEPPAELPAPPLPEGAIAAFAPRCGHDVAQAAAREAKEIPSYFPALDGLRFVCCTAVTVAHCFLTKEIQGDGTGRLGHFMENMGRTGVDVFFSLSGFLITKLLLDEVRAGGRIDLKAFYMRRVLRIWPAYYVAVALGFCLPLLGGARIIQMFGYGRSLEHPFFSEALPMFMLFLSNWTDLPVPSTLGRLWSVGVEEQFYILFPVSFAFATRRYPALRAIGCGLLIAWATRAYLAASGGERFIYLNTFAHGDHLLLGALLAQLLHARPRLLQGLVRRGGAPLELGAVLSCVLLTAVVFPHEPKVLGWWLHYLVMALSTTAVVAVLGLGRGPIAHLLSFRFLRSLGGLTYGGYLFHMYAVVLAWAACSRVPLSPWPAAALRALVAVPLSYLIALGSKRLVEDPFLRLKSRFQARTAAPSHRARP